MKSCGEPSKASMRRSRPRSAAPSPIAISSRPSPKTPMAGSWLLSHRQLEPEEMDDPAIATERLHGALSGLRRLNFVSASARIVWPPIANLARSSKPAPLRVLDIATGAGDIPIALWQRAKRAGVNLEIHGIDINPRS